MRRYLLLVIEAEKFLTRLGLPFVKPGQIGEVENNRVEVIFIKPEALDPNIVIDPPDIRLWVDKRTKEVSLIEQM